MKERAADRGERDAGRSAERGPSQEPRPPETSGPAPGASGQFSEARGERGEGRGRGRRGRRRGRRGGGGARESAPVAAVPESGEAEQAGAPRAAADSGNGSQESTAVAAAPERETPAREYHAEPRESAVHEAAPLAHFEPSPKPESGQNKPYVVWSSAPPKDSGGGRGPEE